MLSAMAPHGREMSQNLRKKNIYFHKKGEGYKKISKALLISQNTVAKVVQTFKKDGTATISQRRPGRPRKLTPRQERLLMRRVEENRHASSLQLFKEVESQTGGTISRDTIRRTLQRNGMHRCHPQKKPLLKPRHKKARLEFARAHADKDEDYWDSILWSDETKINVFGTDGFKTEWRRKGEEYKEKCMVPTVKHGGGSVLMWGCMSAAGVGELHFIDGIMNSQMYCSILNEKMLPLLRALGRHALFQHDNDPKHTSKQTKCHQLVHSMPRRLGAVIKNHGGHKKSTRFSSFCCGVYSFLYHPNLSKTEIYIYIYTHTHTHIYLRLSKTISLN